MDNLLLQVGAGGIFAILLFREAAAFVHKNKKDEKPIVVQLAPGQRVMLDKECSERLLKTMQNTEYLLKQHTDIKEVLQDWRSEREADRQRNDEVLKGLQENTRTLHAIGSQIAVLSVSRK